MPTPAEARTRSAGLRVLVVEDAPADAVLVREMLRDASPGGFAVTHAGRLSAGIQHLLEHGADCVVLDLSLPDPDDLEALGQIRTAALDVPIVVLSGRCDEALALRAVQEGAQDYLIKGQVDARLLARSINYAIERKRGEVQLAHQALHDVLTGLPNRGLFHDRLGQALTRLGRHGDCLAVLFLDLDRFKPVNDSLGHDAGDQLLAALAQRLSSVLRAGDTAARFGGDEFVILCEEVTGSHQAVAIAERIRDALEAPFTIDGDDIVTSVSVGIALASEPTDRPETLIREADAAMYRAKERGGGVYEVFDDDMRVRAVRRLETEDELQRALERGELALHYQPQVRLDTGALVAVEALLRWQHPRRGVLLPGEFLPTAEESGLIHRIGLWTMEQACRQTVIWGERVGPGQGPVTLSVNLSPRQCQHPDLLPALATVLAATGANPADMCLELTETALMEDLDAGLGVLQALKGLGFGLAIDDFGSGSSSLRALQRFPIDTVKIARASVAGVLADPQEAAIVGAVVSFAHALNLEAVAAGLETLAQVDRLRALGCDRAQGFYFAQPAPVAELDRLLGVST